jgi:hypothetical protein
LTAPYFHTGGTATAKAAAQGQARIAARFAAGRDKD